MRAAANDTICGVKARIVDAHANQQENKTVRRTARFRDFAYRPLLQHDQDKEEETK